MDGDAFHQIFLEEEEDVYKRQELHDIHTIANFEKKVPGEWITPDGVGVTQEFLAYMRPLIQAELTPIYVDGLPRHIYIK